MEAAALPNGGARPDWRVQRDGVTFATVATRPEEAGVVVTTRFVGGGGERLRPYRFSDLSGADAFVRDLVASFSYLGCQVAQC